MKPASKQQRIFRHLRKGRAITQQIAIRKFRHYRLASVIHRFRKAGFPVETTMITEGESTYAEYKLRKP